MLVVIGILYKPSCPNLQDDQVKITTYKVNSFKLDPKDREKVHANFSMNGDATSISVAH